MKKIKSLISCLLTAIVLFSSCSMASFAFVTEEKFDIENVTWEDIMTMSNSDFRKLLSDFERVYDPFGTYETNPITQDESGWYDWGVQPYWTSGQKDMSETGSHELITARACGILLDDKGFWGDNRNGSILVALTLSLASIIPDRDADLGVKDLYRGHFYDPDTEKNFAGSKTNTAKTNAVKFYNPAKSQGISNEDFYKSVGCMLHYIQDACEPHHAANYYVPKYMSHKYFEEFADENLNTYIDSVTTISNSVYNDRLNKSVGTIVEDSATIGKSYIDLVDNTLNKTHWGTVAKNTTRLAVIQSAAVLYKLSIEANIPLKK